ncbi:MAG: TonB-dependent receptor [Burkholderiaceae bacterium]|nr:TonB-dependent receptor [Burkholderiaceae bacterium]
MTQLHRKRLRPTAAALAVAALFAAPQLHAQDKTKTDNQQDKALQEVEVVGTSPLPGIGIEKDKLPYDVQTVTDEQLYRGQSLNLTDYMSRNLLGVNINEVQGSPFQADITYRGFRLSGILGSSQGMSVYLDGVRVNEPFGDVVNWDMIPEAAIGNVTLVPGSNPVYGLNTLGGALAFTTKSGLTTKGGEARLQAGSFGRARADVSYGSRGDDGYHSFVAATGFREDGWRDYSSGNLGNVFAKIGRQQNDSNWDLSLLVGRSNLLGNGLLPSNHFGTAEDIEDEAAGVGPSVRGSGMYESNRRSVYTHPDRTRNELNQLTFNFQRLLDANTELAVNAYLRQSKRRTVGGDAEREEIDTGPNAGDFENEAVLNLTNTASTSYGTSANLTKIMGAHQLTTGVAVDASRSRYGASQADDCALSVTRLVSGCDPAEDDAKVRGKSYAVGIYGSDTWQVAQATHVTAAARFNHANVSNTITNFPNGVGVERPHESFYYNSLNPSLGVAHQMSGAVTVFGNLGQSNRVPTVIELGCADPAEPCRLPTGLQADPYLKQVIARTLEAGIRWQIDSSTGMSAAAYRSENRDDILFRALDNNGNGYFSNFSRTRRQGVDLSVYTTIAAVSLRASYSYLDATYQANGSLFGGERDITIRPGTKIAGLPDHTLRLNADWRTTEKLTLGGSVLTTSSLVSQGNEDGRVGAEEDPSESIAASAKVKGYTILNLHANYEAAKGLDYFARINNVLDTRFETYGLMAMSMFNADGSTIATAAQGPTMNRFVAPGAPRNFMVGVRYRF